MRLQQEHASDHDTLLVEEMGVSQGAARIDVAVLNGVLSGYEIKSPSDTLARLPGQRDLYNQVFDFVTLVTSSRYLEAIEAVIPEWWGLIQASPGEAGEIVLQDLRLPTRNTDLDPHTLVQLLWKEETIDILDGLGLARGVRGKPRQAAWDRLVQAVPMPELADLVRERVKARPEWRERAPSLSCSPTAPAQT